MRPQVLWNKVVCFVAVWVSSSLMIEPRYHYVKKIKAIVYPFYVLFPFLSIGLVSRLRRILCICCFQLSESYKQQLQRQSQRSCRRETLDPSHWLTLISTCLFLVTFQYCPAALFVPNPRKLSKQSFSYPSYPAKNAAVGQCPSRLAICTLGCTCPERFCTLQDPVLEKHLLPKHPGHAQSFWK